MQLDIIYIINNKLHNLKYLNFTIIFYIIFVYTYYSLFVYFINKNYIIILLYLIFFIFTYSSYKNFTYFIGFIILIFFKIFNLDNIVNNNKLIEGAVNFDSIMTRVNAKAKKKGDDLEADSNENKPVVNPCKSYIIDRVQKAGINISTKSQDSGDTKKNTAATMDDIMSGQEDIEAPTILRIT